MTDLKVEKGEEVRLSMFVSGLLNQVLPLCGLSNSLGHYQALLGNTAAALERFYDLFSWCVLSFIFLSLSLPLHVPSLEIFCFQ